jgi:hypothetical protein
MDAWLFADSIYSRRFYVVHAEAPRFIAEIGEEDDEQDIAGVFCHPDLTRWIDPRPDGDALSRLARATAEALAAYNAWLDADGAFSEAEERELSGGEGLGETEIEEDDDDAEA